MGRKSTLSKIREQTVIDAIHKYKGNCVRIAEHLKIGYPLMLTFKKKFIKHFEPYKHLIRPNVPPVRAKIGDEKLKQIIINCGGLTRDVAKKCGVSYDTISRWKRDPEIAAAFRIATENMLDITESNLHKNIKDRDNSAMFFYLKCKGQHRGYIESQRSIIMSNDEFERMQEDELDRRIGDIERSLEGAENRTVETKKGKAPEALPK